MFKDGTESEELKCTDSKFGMSCDDETSDPTARTVYEQLRLKPIAAIRTRVKRYAVSDETAKAILGTFSCIRS